MNTCPHTGPAFPQGNAWLEFHRQGLCSPVCQGPHHSLLLSLTLRAKVNRHVLSFLGAMYYHPCILQLLHSFTLEGNAE